MPDPIDLENLTIPDAQLVQHGLMKLGYYEGTTLGLPGPKTKAAYAKYLADKSPPEPDAVDPFPLKRLPALLSRILEREVGVREVPKNSNRGHRVEEYQAATWLDGSGWPWCAAFICWGVREAGKLIDLPFDRPQTAGAWDFERWARTQERDGVKLYKPRRSIRKGDIVVFTFSHIGLAIEDESGGYVTTVEGNTDSSGSRDGGGVYRKRRAVSLVRSHIRLPS